MCSKLIFARGLSYPISDFDIVTHEKPSPVQPHVLNSETVSCSGSQAVDRCALVQCFMKVLERKLIGKAHNEDTGTNAHVNFNVFGPSSPIHLTAGRRGHMSSCPQMLSAMQALCRTPN